MQTINQNLVVTAGADWIGYITDQDNANKNVTFGAVASGNTLPLIGFDGQNGPTSWGVNGGSYLECCAGGLTVAKNRRLGLVFVNNWLWTKGRQTFNIGGQFRRTYQDIVNCDFCSGTFNFSQRTTSTPDSTDPNFGAYGSSFASFLLGQADASIRVLSDELYMRNKAFAFYVQDDIKYNNRLTFNVGLRYDILVPFTENNNNIIFVNTSTPNPGAGNLPGAATKFGNCTGCAGVNRASISWKNWQPRLGFAYQLNSKTVLRSGFYTPLWMAAPTNTARPRAPRSWGAYWLANICVQQPAAVSPATEAGIPKRCPCRQRLHLVLPSGMEPSSSISLIRIANGRRFYPIRSRLAWPHPMSPGASGFSASCPGICS